MPDSACSDYSHCAEAGQAPAACCAALRRPCADSLAVLTPAPAPALDPGACSQSLMHERRLLLEAAADAASDQAAREAMEEEAAAAAEHAARHREAQRLFQEQAARAAEDKRGRRSSELLQLEELERKLQRQAAEVEQSARVGGATRAGGALARPAWAACSAPRRMQGHS